MVCIKRTVAYFTVQNAEMAELSVRTLFVKGAREKEAAVHTAVKGVFLFFRRNYLDFGKIVLPNSFRFSANCINILFSYLGLKIVKSLIYTYKRGSKSCCDFLFAFTKADEYVFSFCKTGSLTHPPQICWECLVR